MKRKRSIRRKVRRTSKLPIAKLQRKLWVYCKLLIRKLYGNTCYTCDKKGLEGSSWQTGHFIPKSTCGALLKYDLRNLRPQCFHCNLNLGGNVALFMQKLIIREGQEYVDQIFKDRLLIIKPYDHYLSLVEKYKIMLEEI